MRNLQRGDTVRVNRDIHVSLLWGFGSRVAVYAGSVGVVTAGPSWAHRPQVRFDGGLTFEVPPADLDLLEPSGHARGFRWGF